MNKTVAIIQARSTSTRLPEKIGMPIGDKTVLQTCVDNVRPAVDEVRIVIPYNDIRAWNISKDLGCKVIEGPEEDVLHRYWLASLDLDTYDNIIRVTSDCPFIDTEVVHYVVSQFNEMQYDISADYYTTFPRWGAKRLPQGTAVEAMTAHSLHKLQTILPARDPKREHVTQGFYKDVVDRFATFSPIYYLHGLPDYGDYNYSIDTARDYDLALEIYHKLGYSPAWRDVVNLIDERNKEEYDAV